MKKIKKYRNFMLRLIDIVIIIAAYYLAEAVINNNFGLGQNIFDNLTNTIIIAIVIYQIVLTISNSYRNITRYENGNDYIVYVLACLVSYTIVTITKLFVPIETVGMNTSLIAALIIVVSIIGYRVVLRFVLVNNTIARSEKSRKNAIDNNNSDNIETEIKNILIIGAGEASKEIIKAIKTTMRNRYNIVGIIDDNSNKWKYSISGVNILGGRKKILEIAEKEEVDEIFFSITKIDNKNRKDILAICQETNAKVRVLPSTEELIKNKSLLENFKEVEIEDLLGRDPIVLDNNNIENVIKGKTVLVTGGGGSIGSELCRQIITYEPKELLILDNYENNLYEIELELKEKYFNTKVIAIVASVRDKEKLETVFNTYEPKLVFHAAAHKHVPLMEANPLEAIKNNVLGTKNVADLADKYQLEKFILVSTDKAVNPTNIMGATKRLCEMIIQTKNKNSKTEYAAVRFGNVLGSNGSVVPVFKKQIKNGGPITLTHKEITRFFMTIPEAVGLILQAMTYANGGEIFVLDMGEPVKIYDLAVSLIKLSGFRPDIDIPIEITGLRPGEKLYEELLMSEEGLDQTAHKKIFIAEPLELEEAEVNKRIGTLEELIRTKNYNRKVVKDTMKKAVPTYVEPEEMNKKHKID